MPILLVIEIIYVWYGLYRAKFYEYDDNFGVIIHCFLISIVTLIALTVLFFYRRQVFKQNALILFFWFILASPFTVFIVIMNYKAIFNAELSL